MDPRIPHHMVVMFRAPQLYLRVKYPFVCHSPRYTAVRIKNRSKSTCVITVAAMRKYDGAACPSYRLKLKYPFSFSVRYFRLITQQHESRTV